MRPLSNPSSKRVSQQNFNGLTVLLLLAVLPHLPSFPLFLSGFCVFAAAGFLPFIRNNKIIQKLFTLLVVVALLLSLYFSFGNLLSGDAIRSFFIVVLVLKWTEAKTRRDALGLAFASCLLAALGVLYQSPFWGMLYLFVVVFALIVVIMSIQQVSSTKHRLLRKSSRLLPPALPIMVLLFLIFPRLNGPLWDLGIALGLPLSVMLDQNKDQRGIEKTLKPGQIKRIKQSDDTVLVAEFLAKVPYVSRLYWRGPVYWDFDGQQWAIAKDWNNRSKLLRTAYKSSAAIAQQMRINTPATEYNLRLLAHGERWMYALDIPTMTAPESFVSADFQLLSIRKTVREVNMRLSAYLDYSVGLVLSDQQRARALAWPEGSNPRLKELGLELKQHGLNSADLSSHVLGLFAQGDYQLNDNALAEPATQSLDQFFFDSKTGDVQQLASSFVMLMRAAGIPSRLVAGYRGGSIIALSDFVIVKKKNAHVWAEIWQTAGGWVRVEAKDAVVKPKVQSGAGVAEKPKTKPIEKIAAKTLDQQTLTTAPKKTVKQAAQPSQEADDWLVNWQKRLQGVFSSLQKWVLNYNPQRQSELLQTEQRERLKVSELLLTGLLLSVLLAACYLLLIFCLTYKNKDPVNDAFEQFCRYYAKRGLVRASWECPSYYATRLTQQFPQHAPAISTLVKNYLDLRYGPTERYQQREFVRQIKRFLAMI